MAVLYCDESGYTGTDLLSATQPFLVISSLLLDDAEVVELAAPLKAVTQAKEIKYSTLVKRPRSRIALVEFVHRMDAIQPQIRFHLSNKRYALLGKLVDLVVEPLLHANGVNFYADGRNVAFLNTLFVAGVTQAPPEHDRTLRSFLELCRAPTDEAYRQLAEALNAMSKRSRLLNDLCTPIRAGLDVRRRLAPQSLDKADLSLVTSCVISLIRQWNVECGGPVEVVADASNELFRSQDVLAALSNPSVPHITEVAGDRVIGLPLHLTGFSLVDSRSALGVQLADVAAGIVSHAQLALDDAEARIAKYSQEVMDVVTEWPRMLQIIPEAKFTVEQMDRIGFDGNRIVEATMRAFEGHDAE